MTDRSQSAAQVRIVDISTSTRITDGHEPAVKDHYIVRDGRQYAGEHLILDFHDAQRLDDAAYMEQAMRAAVDAAGATLLHIHLHRFSPSGGLSGVAVLAESHISVHTWPERHFAAFDVFMCGYTNPARAGEVLSDYFAPGRADSQSLLRG
ncbi:MAG: adenosylmethionine decarboxylase [Gammaproteobacteria bacterium]|nr:adenosylmethionine decarboxylase [Gammaproteobacteria bacterium]